MKRALLTLVATGLLVAGSASEARAALGWLEKLSGPGPFIGIVASLPLWCFDPASEGSKIPMRDWECAELVEAAARSERARLRRVVIGADVFRLWTDDNDLPYAPEHSNLDPGVRITGAIGTVALVPVHGFKVGSGFGVAWFSGDRFDTFARSVFQPLRLSVSPLLFFTDPTRGVRRWEGFLKLHLNGTIFLGGFEARDFNALGGFRESYELQWQTTIEIDPVLLFKGR